MSVLLRDMAAVLVPFLIATRGMPSAGMVQRNHGHESAGVLGGAQAGGARSSARAVSSPLRAARMIFWCNELLIDEALFVVSYEPALARQDDRVQPRAIYMFVDVVDGPSSCAATKHRLVVKAARAGGCVYILCSSSELECFGRRSHSCL